MNLFDTDIGVICPVVQVSANIFESTKRQNLGSKFAKNRNSINDTFEWLWPESTIPETSVSYRDAKHGKEGLLEYRCVAFSIYCSALVWAVGRQRSDYKTISAHPHLLRSSS